MYKYFFGIFCFCFTGLYLFFPIGMNYLGKYLIVDEPIKLVDAVIAQHINDKVLDCYQKKKCKKIIFLNNHNSGINWKAIQSISTKNFLVMKNRASDIIKHDLIELKIETRRDEKIIQTILNFLNEKNFETALFLFPYYKTRRYRFFLDRLSFSTNLKIYIQPLTKDFSPDLKIWWKKTTYLNYFLSEYIHIGYYYFKKILWINNNENLLL